MKEYHLFHIPTHKSNKYLDVEMLCNDLWGANIWDYVLVITTLSQNPIVWDWNITLGDLNALEEILKRI